MCHVITNLDEPLDRALSRRRAVAGAERDQRGAVDARAPERPRGGGGEARAVRQHVQDLVAAGVDSDSSL